MTSTVAMLAFKPRYSAALFDSYVEISNFCRGRRQPSTHTFLKCRRKTIGRAGFRTTPRLRTEPVLEDAQSTDPITQGFPDPPASGFAKGLLGESTSSADSNVDQAQVAQATGWITDAATTASATSTIVPHLKAALKRYQNLYHGPFGSESWKRLTESSVANSKSVKDANEIRICGYITGQRRTKIGTFMDLVDPHLRQSIQLFVPKSGQVAQQDFKSTSIKMAGSNVAIRNALQNISKIQPHTPVMVTGRLLSREPLVTPSISNAAPEVSPSSQTDSVQTKDDVEPSTEDGKTRKISTRTPAFRSKLDPVVGTTKRMLHVEIEVESITELNTIPRDLIAQHDTEFPPEKRHLQFRTKNDLRDTIRMRSKAGAEIRKYLFRNGFDEIETPLLFKSTPEGAREFVVPTRKEGLAYALPQSPQQYKQLLMGSGISKYFQFARCFRDEDMRADRQPEFTQIDIEIAFAESKEVMDLVNGLLSEAIWPWLRPGRPFPYQDVQPPTNKKVYSRMRHMTYQEAMQNYGSDKPDVRFGARIQQIQNIVPESLRRMITPIEDPIVEVMTVKMFGSSPAASAEFVSKFMGAPSSSAYLTNSAGAPGIAIYDPKKPLGGLASFGHEAASKVEELLQPEPGHIVIIQARPNAPFHGGSTPLGNLRLDMHHALVAENLRKAPSHDEIVWVTDFPLFSPISQDAPGQAGSAGICSTHHPFTAPKAGQDLELLVTDPLSVVADHYDLVINGVEIGGGSRRIHSAEMQGHIFRDVLKMDRQRVKDFQHLLNVLRDGCPPHAGIALGFDRLLALLMGKNSVRDVIAFPKYGDGEDKMVGAPSRMTRALLDTYHLQVRRAAAPEEPSTPFSVES